MREIVLATDGTCAVKARDFATDCLNEAGIGGEDAYDILLALNEAVTNSCRHAGDAGVILTILCELIEGRFVIQIVDNGHGFDFSEEMYEMPEPLSQGGRGFFLMRELMDDVSVSTDGYGTRVTLSRSLRSPDPARGRTSPSNGASV